jgi:hypothetical protein
MLRMCLDVFRVEPQAIALSHLCSRSARPLLAAFFDVNALYASFPQDKLALNRRSMNTFETFPQKRTNRAAVFDECTLKLTLSASLLHVI